jgi:hypothetical protein
MFGKRLYQHRALVSGFALAILLFGSGASPAAAEKVRADLREQRQGTVAVASSDQCTPTGDKGLRCRSFTVDIFDGAELSSERAPFRGTRVCVSLLTYTVVEGEPQAEGNQEERGCATLPAGTLQVARDLASVTLPATAITLEQVRCTPVGEHEAVCEVIGSRKATISGTWTATSPLISSHDRNQYRNGTCVETSEYREQRRDTTAELTLDGEAQPVQYSSVANVSSRITRQCR